MRDDIKVDIDATTPTPDESFIGATIKIISNNYLPEGRYIIGKCSCHPDGWPVSKRCGPHLLNMDGSKTGYVCYYTPTGLWVVSGIISFVGQAATYAMPEIGPLPRNNDGRTTCAWCSSVTRKAGGGMYDICTVCGK